MRPGFIETIEVLAIIPASALVQRFERTVFVSEGKSAPVCTPWPESVFARHRVEASVFGHIAAEHFCEHRRSIVWRSDWRVRAFGCPARPKWRS